MTMHPFDLAALFDAVERERAARELSWAALSRTVGVAASTIRRYATADDAEADGVLALIRWLNAIPEDFVPGTAVSSTSALAPNGVVRVDMARIAELEAMPATSRPRQRTTMQRLAAVAQRHSLPIADLVRAAPA